MLIMCAELGLLSLPRRLRTPITSKSTPRTLSDCPTAFPSGKNSFARSEPMTATRAIDPASSSVKKVPAASESPRKAGQFGVAPIRPAAPFQPFPSTREPRTICSEPTSRTLGTLVRMASASSTTSVVTDDSRWEVPRLAGPPCMTSSTSSSPIMDRNWASTARRAPSPVATVTVRQAEPSTRPSPISAVRPGWRRRVRAASCQVECAMVRPSRECRREPGGRQPGRRCAPPAPPHRDRG